MAIIDYFARSIAMDVDGNIVRNAEATVYALSDPSLTSPLSLLDMQGVPMVKLTAGSTGMYPPFRVVGDVRQVVAVSSGSGRELRTELTSLYGLLLDVVPDPTRIGEAVSATKAAAQTAEDAKARAEEARDGAVETVTVALPPLVAQLIGQDPTVLQAAAEYAQSASGLVRKVDLEADVFQVQFENEDGTLAPPLLEADEERGIFSKITHRPASVPPAATSFLFDLPRESGWDWGFFTEDRRVVFGQRLDGSFYPENIGGAPEPEPIVPTPIVQWGDSLTAGWAATFSQVAAALNRASVNFGVGGQSAPQIAARQGGKPALLTVTGNQIPASGAVALTAWSTNLLQRTADGSSSMQGTLRGVPGTLTMTRSTVNTTTTVTYVFTRTTPGAVVPVPPSTPFVGGLGYRHHIPIVCIGRNGFATADPSATVDLVRRMLRYSVERERALVLSIPPWESETSGSPTRAVLDSHNAALRDEFGEFWFDWAAHLRSTAVMESVGLTPGGPDQQNIADGITPVQFRSDAGHFNGPAYQALNAQIIIEATTRGW